MRAALFALVAALALAPAAARAISRDAVMTRARAFAYHPWRATTANETASCNGAYRSVYGPGDYLGLPYDWGGYMTLPEFDQQIAAGAGAGSYPDDGVLSCTAGLDCSGFVSQTWGASHHTTSNLATISTTTTIQNLLPGDVMNKSGYHVSLFSHRLGNGDPVFYEAIGYNVHVNTTGAWSWWSGFTPLRYQNITGTTDSNPLGTPTNPIPIDALPFHDTRDTRNSTSSVLDRCAAAPDKNESGPEYVYRVTLTQPGQLTVSVSDDVGVDIDVHLYTSLSTLDCTARNDLTFTKAVDCGTYYIVADTYGGATAAGPYDLTVTFAPSGAGCGAGPRQYDFPGGPGDACAYPDHEDLPFCNQNLGADTCLYTTSSSFCSMPCTGAGDCAALPGGCCLDIGDGENYCMPASYCPSADGGAGSPDGGIGSSVPDAGTPQDIGDLDAGTESDAGVAPDAGTAPDAGLAPDAGVHADAGTPGRDAGTGGRDAGVEENPPEATSGGCSATGAGDPSLLAVGLALGALALRRRRRSRR